MNPMCGGDGREAPRAGSPITYIVANMKIHVDTCLKLKNVVSQFGNGQYSFYPIDLCSFGGKI